MEKSLPSAVLLEAQNKTLRTPRRRYGVLAFMLFQVMDFVYGRERTLPKFKVLEVIARVPYQAWENVAYVAMTHQFSKPGFARRIFEFVKESREQQDNEQWHLFILEEMIHREKIDQNFFLFRFAPQVIAFFYYHVSWILYVINPALSYRLNADFEDHAEHEYMNYVSEHPELETEKYESEFRAEYGDFKSTADLFRQIGHDERMHKEESEDRMRRPRFA